MAKKAHKNFIRISWEEAMVILKEGIQEKYEADGRIILKKEYGSESVSDFPDAPDFVDIELEE